MKNLTYYVGLMAFSVFFLASCSKEEIEEMDSANLTSKVAPVAYTSIELEILDLINNYREEQGLPGLIYLDESSIQAAGHNEHMIENDEVCHHNFGSRYAALVNGFEAKAVSENVAFGYRTADAVVHGWINSDGHKKNIEGEYSHFGISVKEGKDGKKYYTNIFVRK